jgi:hypothetical protein
VAPKDGLSWEVLVAIGTAFSRDFSVKCFQSIVSIVLYMCLVHLNLHATRRS